MLLNFFIFLLFYCFFNFFNFLTIFINFNLIFFIFFFFFYNYFFLKIININFNSNLDLFIKYLKFFTKHFFNLINIIFIIVKKLYNFIYIKFFVFSKSSIFFFNFYIKNLFIIWRPLFKKWSYFGYYRINRSKWIK